MESTVVLLGGATRLLAQLHDDGALRKGLLNDCAAGWARAAQLNDDGTAGGDRRGGIAASKTAGTATTR